MFFFVCFSQRKLLLNGVFSFQIQEVFVKNSVNFFSLMFEFVELFEFSDVSNHFRSHDLDGKTKCNESPSNVSQKFPTEFRRMFLQTFKKGGPSRSPVREREGGGSKCHSPVITGSNRKILVKE